MVDWEAVANVCMVPYKLKEYSQLLTNIADFVLEGLGISKVA